VNLLGGVFGFWSIKGSGSPNLSIGLVAPVASLQMKVMGQQMEECLWQVKLMHQQIKTLENEYEH